MNIVYAAPSPAEAISNGLRLLDEQRPGWRAKVRAQRDVFDLTSHYNCVLGIIEGDYGRAVWNLCGYGPFSPEAIEWAQLHGFLGRVDQDSEVDIEEIADDTTWAELQQTWLEVLV